MRLAVPRSKDFWAGMTFILLGGLALWIGQDYAVGTARRMGPGYFPALLGWILCILGAIVAVRGLAVEGETVPRGALRPFLVLVGVIAFALLLQSAGLVVATLALIVIGSLGGREFRLLEVAALALALILLAIVVFVWGLGLQFTVWPAL
jgi:hypothetical protein